MAFGLRCQVPSTPARWLYGEGVGVQVWEIDAHADQRALVVIGIGSPIVLLNRAIVGTALEWPTLRWALEQAASAPAPGVYVQLA